MIIVEDVHKRYLTEHGPGEWVLRGVSFKIPPKLSVGLIGRNGAGKSTLLRLIGGIDIPTRGKVERQCRVSWPMGFGGGLQGTLSGRQNAKFVCRIHGHEEDIPERLATIEEFADLGTYFDEPVKTYSSGMRSRLNFALSLAFDFDVYISDEVTAVGDAAFNSKSKEAFKKLADHASIIMVSHSEGTLRDFCTAGIWLHEGQAHWFDDIKDALYAYKNSSAESAVKQAPEKMIKQALEPDGKPIRNVAMAKLRRVRASLDCLEAGLNGQLQVLGKPELTRTIQHAKRLGFELLTAEQIAERGRQLKEGAIPILKLDSAQGSTATEYYEFSSQGKQKAHTE